MSSRQKENVCRPYDWKVHSIFHSKPASEQFSFVYAAEKVWTFEAVFNFRWWQHDGANQLGQQWVCHWWVQKRWWKIDSFLSKLLIDQGEHISSSRWRKELWQTNTHRRTCCGGGWRMLHRLLFLHWWVSCFRTVKICRGWMNLLCRHADFVCRASWRSWRACQLCLFSALQENIRM